jgi:hypothetical protein
MSTYNVHGCTCGICTVERKAAERRMQGEIWSALVADARRDQARRVARRAKTAQTISHAAQDYGIAPHSQSDDCGGCRRRSTINRIAASVIRHANGRGPLKPVTTLTAWEMAAHR